MSASTKNYIPIRDARWLSLTFIDEVKYLKKATIKYNNIDVTVTINVFLIKQTCSWFRTQFRTLPETNMFGFDTQTVSNFSTQKFKNYKYYRRKQLYGRKKTFAMLYISKSSLIKVFTVFQSRFISTFLALIHPHPHPIFPNLLRL